MDKDSNDKLWDELENCLFDIDDDLTIVNNSYEKEIENLDRKLGQIPNTNRNNTEKYYKQIYSLCEREPDNKTNYNNTNFCVCCKNQLVIPDTEINNFVNAHINTTKKKYIKYLLTVFRLCPKMLPFSFIMSNKFLREYIYNYLKLPDNFKNNLNKRTVLDINSDYLVYNTYMTKTNRKITPFVYEIYFHQPNLNYDDYSKCSICCNYICPMHLYLSNSIYSHCNLCGGRWLICGWCKPSFNEYYACKFIHKNKS